VGKTNGEIFEEARKFYYDMVLSSNLGVLDLLLKFAKKGYVLFRSDFPNTPNEAIRYYTKQLEGHFGVEVRREIAH
jgi:6-methylsalicylate decarboxylase